MWHDNPIHMFLGWKYDYTTVCCAGRIVRKSDRMWYVVKKNREVRLPWMKGRKRMKIAKIPKSRTGGRGVPRSGQVEVSACRKAPQGNFSRTSCPVSGYTVWVCGRVQDMFLRTQSCITLLLVRQKISPAAAKWTPFTLQRFWFTLFRQVQVSACRKAPQGDFSRTSCPVCGYTVWVCGRFFADYIVHIHGWARRNKSVRIEFYY